jgi:hypothetical protein
MPFSPNTLSGPCPVCGMQANRSPNEQGDRVDCSQCGDFEKRYSLQNNGFGSPITDQRLRALASHLIRQMQSSPSRPVLGREFFDSLHHRALPTPIEAMDNLLVLVASKVAGQPGLTCRFNYEDGEVISSIGVCTGSDVGWVTRSLKELGLVGGSAAINSATLNLTARGWDRFSQLVSAKISSRYAFFARKFDNPELDIAFKDCLYPAVKATGYELRPATQKAGPVDAIIEDEIRRCRFLIADLSDDNLGAYWEAGFAEGLGKPVIYVCRDKDPKTGAPKKTHFDTDHRHTVRWSLDSLDETSTRLKAVIRNTLLGDAAQADQ